MTGLEYLRSMTVDELTEWLFNFALNCDGKGKMDIRMWLTRETNKDWMKEDKL